MKDSWLRAAITDDNIVADFLLRLKDSPSSSSSSPPPPAAPPQEPPQEVPQEPPHTVILKCLPPSWGVRLPRSKHSPPPPTLQPAPLFDNINNKTRRSPTTPLSWTYGGAASPSDGCDDSLSSLHHRPPSDLLRSKISASTETPTTTSSKRPRRKKTFAELKEEESSLLKESLYLKKELATLRLSVKEQRSINENLKRRKLDLHVETRIKSESNSVDECNHTSNGASEAASSSVTRLADKIEDASEPDSQSQKQPETSQEQLFVLPDLNMVPEEDTVGPS